MCLKSNKHLSIRRRERGAALVVGLVLLMVITVLAISGMSTATLELQMAGNFQYAHSAFQAADIGIERFKRAERIETDPTLVIVPRGQVPGTFSDHFDTLITADPHATTALVPGYGDVVTIYHFDITSVGTSARNARSVNTQSFYLVGAKAQ